jgi:hypothetical protein
MFPDTEGEASTDATKRESEDPGDQGPIACGCTETHHQPKLMVMVMVMVKQRIAHFEA